MKKYTIISVGLVFLMSLTLLGCATTSRITKLKEVKKYAPYEGGHIDQIMVVGYPRINANRIKYEDHMVKLLSKRNLTAIPSYTRIPDMNDLNRENIKQAAVDSGTKVVLVTKVVGIDEKDVLIKQSVGMDTVQTPYGVYMQPRHIEGPRIEKFTKVRVETGLFEVKSENLFWAATSAIMDPDTADEAINDFSAAIIERLEADGYVPPSFFKSLFY